MDTPDWLLWLFRRIQRSGGETGSWIWISVRFEVIPCKLLNLGRIEVTLSFGEYLGLL